MGFVSCPAVPAEYVPDAPDPARLPDALSEAVKGIRRRYDVVLDEAGMMKFVEIKAYTTISSVSGKARMQFFKDLIIRQRSDAHTPFIWVFPKNFMPGASKQMKIAALREKLQVDSLERMLGSAEAFELQKMLKVDEDAIRKSLRAAFDQIDEIFKFES